MPGPARSSRSFLSRCSHAVLSVCILLVLITGAGFVILRSGVDSNLLRDEAQKSLTHILGEGASASIGSAALSLDQDSHVALEARMCRSPIQSRVWKSAESNRCVSDWRRCRF